MYIYIYMKWKIPLSWCKYLQFTNILNWSTKLWKNIHIWKLDSNIDWGVEIWDYTWLSDRVMFYSQNEFKIKIWKFCSIWNGVAFIASMNHNYNYLTTCTWKLKPKNFKNIWWTINIWNDVRIWKNAIIMKWVNIWTWAVIGAWAIVTKNVPPYSIVWWNPAKIIKYRFDKETIDELLKSERRDRDIWKIKENYNIEFLNKH